MVELNSFHIQDLPVELQRDIFEQAARAQLGSALRLVLVSRQLKEWVQPLVYEMVTLGLEDSALFLRTMETLPAEFFAQWVKRLCLTVSTPPMTALRILETCTGVTSLACWVDFHRSAQISRLTQLLSRLPLRRLSIEVGHFSRISLPQCGWVNSITHLDIIFWHQQQPVAVPGLRSMSALTHLALYLEHENVEEGYLTEILSSVSALRILCIVTYESGEDVEHTTVPIDPRIVYMPRPDLNVPDWEAPYRGQKDTWAHAEEVLLEQLAQHTANMRV